jgi:hypothetical protein
MEENTTNEILDGALEIVAKLVDPVFASQYLKSTVDTMAGWRVKGIGPRYRKCGRLVRYTLEDLDAYLRANTFNSTSQYPACSEGNDPPPRRGGRPKK